MDLDGISIEDILGNRIAVITDAGSRMNRALTVTAQGARLRITLPVAVPADPVVLRVFDLKGRLIAATTISPRAFSAGGYTWNLRQGAGRLGRGIYTVSVTTGIQTKLFRITLTGTE